jgi:hypothetical protein
MGRDGDAPDVRDDVEGQPAHDDADDELGGDELGGDDPLTEGAGHRLPEEDAHEVPGRGEGDRRQGLEHPGADHRGDGVGGIREPAPEGPHDEEAEGGNEPWVDRRRSPP